MAKNVANYTLFVKRMWFQANSLVILGVKTTILSQYAISHSEECYRQTVEHSKVEFPPKCDEYVAKSVLWEHRVDFG